MNLDVILRVLVWRASVFMLLPGAAGLCLFGFLFLPGCGPVLSSAMELKVSGCCEVLLACPPEPR